MQTHEVLNTAFIDSFRRRWTIVGSSNGLICVELAGERGRTPVSYLVWNPLTNEVREVEVLDFMNDHCDATTFGYSSVVDDYKIVRFCQEDIDGGYEIFYGVEVFSLCSGSWKVIKLEGLPNYIEVHHKPAHVNGTIFWYGSSYYSHMLVAFDIATEVFTITPIDTFSANVDVQEYGRCPHRVYEYGNKLAMCCLAGNIVNDDYKGYNIIMWVIEEYGGESGKSYRYTERYKFGPNLEDYVLQPTCFWRNELVCPYIIRNEAEAESDERNYLHLFNLISKEWNKFPNFSGAYDRCDTFNYEKSLSASLRRLA